MMSFSVGGREEKMTKSVMYERKGAGVGRGGGPQYRRHEGYGHHYHHHHVGSDGGAAFESRGVFRKATQTQVLVVQSAGEKARSGGRRVPVWTSLLKDLVEKVLAFLPLHSLFQARIPEAHTHQRAGQSGSKRCAEGLKIGVSG